MGNVDDFDSIHGRHPRNSRRALYAARIAARGSLLQDRSP
jgi:hypothetical protein